MKVRVYATKPDGYWWKAPSWDNGRKFELQNAVDLDLAADDMARLVADVKSGLHLRYERVEEPAPAPAPEKKAK